MVHRKIITNICIKNPYQRSRIFHTIVVKYVAYKRRWLISHSSWFCENRKDRMEKHGICKILASSMFNYIQEVNIVISQQICNFFSALICVRHCIIQQLNWLISVSGGLYITPIMMFCCLSNCLLFISINNVSKVPFWKQSSSRKVYSIQSLI